MQRKATKNTRGPNSQERLFQGWLKEQPCAWCGNDGPSIVDHCKGATFKHNKVLIGHWFCLPACVECDTKKTIHGKRLGNEAERWQEINEEYFVDTSDCAPCEGEWSIFDWCK